jgi:ornithine cyclodeaminase/alanine dehydrogenase
MAIPGSLLLQQSEVRELLSFAECVDIVEEAFSLHGVGKSMKPGLLHVDSGVGEFHVKAGGLEFEQRYFALKANGSFFQNSVRLGLPNIQGVILLSDGENGYPLAIMDSREITMKRTGAATAVAAKYLAKKSSDVVVICGSGLQARIQLLALASVFALRQAFLFSRNAPKAEVLAERMSNELGFPVLATQDLQGALRMSQICVTCTPAHHFYVNAEDVVPGLFIAAVGADSPGKQEIDPRLLRSHKVVADILEQSLHVGDLQHAIAQGMRKEEVYAELSEIVLGTKPGRTSEEEIIIFDSTGTALQDVAAAVAVYKKAVSQGKGTIFNFFG